MTSITSLAETAVALGDPARLNMLAALMDGRALTAGELARVAGVAPSTGSGHLSLLLEAGLLAVERQGRHRYHRLASPEVARVLEGLMALSATRPRPVPVTGPPQAAMRAARTCYDHLAGRLAVGIADSLVARGHLEMSGDGGRLTATGESFLRDLGVTVRVGGARPFCRPCLDWSERRPHIAGALGAALCARCVEIGWVRRVTGSRALTVTPAGERGFREAFGIGAAQPSDAISAAL